MAPRLNRRRPAPIGFPGWAEFIAIALVVVWLIGLVALTTDTVWVHLLLPLAFGVLGISYWNNRSPRGDI